MIEFGLNINGEEKRIRFIPEDGKVLLLEERPQGDLSVKVLKGVKEVPLFHLIEPVGVMFCWDDDCDIVEPKEIQDYIESLIKESGVDVLEEAQIVALYPIVALKDGRGAFIGRLFNVEVG
jgi:hypothetical protein